MPVPGGVLASPDGRRREGFDNPAYGDASWVTLFSQPLTPTAAMSAGVMELPPHGGRLQPHRHAQAEIYYVVAGTGQLSIDGVERAVTAGTAAFIPGDALHSLRNEADEVLRVFYVFPTDGFGEIAYRFEGVA